MAGVERPRAQAEPRAEMMAETLARAEQVPVPVPLSEPEPQPAPELMEELQPIAAETPAEPAGGMPEEAPLSDEDIERILNAKPEPEPEAVQSLVDGEHEEQEAVNPEDIPDPEPLPEVFTAADRDEIEDSGGGHKALWGILVVLVLLAVVGTGLFFGRGIVIVRWPSTEQLYSMVGIERLGAGLQLVDMRNEWLNAKDRNDLVVHGVIANNSDRERSVPMLRIELRDVRDEVVQVYVYPPEKTSLVPGERLNFKVHVGEVLRTAKRTHIIWTDELPPETEKAPDKPAG